MMEVKLVQDHLWVCDCELLLLFLSLLCGTTVVKVRNFAEHLRHVRAVLHHLLAHKLYVKAEKSEFHVKETSFLGYRIGLEGLAMDDNKVAGADDSQRATEILGISIADLQPFIVEVDASEVGLGAVLSQYNGIV